MWLPCGGLGNLISVSRSTGSRAGRNRQVAWIWLCCYSGMKVLVKFQENECLFQNRNVKSATVISLTVSAYRGLHNSGFVTLTNISESRGTLGTSRTVWFPGALSTPWDVGNVKLAQSCLKGLTIMGLFLRWQDWACRHINKNFKWVHIAFLLKWGGVCMDPLYY